MVYRSFIGLFFISFLFIACSKRTFQEAQKIKKTGNVSYDVNSKFSFSELKLKSEIIIDLSNGKNIKMNAITKIKKDSSIIISVMSSLGSEFLKFYIDKDSVKLLNRMEKTYYCGPIDSLGISGQSLNIHVLQQAMIGQFITTCIGNINLEDRTNKEFKRIVLENCSADSLTYYVYMVNIKNSLIDKFEVIGKSVMFRINYIYGPDKTMLPDSLNFDLFFNNQQFLGSFIIKDYKIESGQDYRFFVPGNYKKMYFR